MANFLCQVVSSDDFTSPFVYLMSIVDILIGPCFALGCYLFWQLRSVLQILSPLTQTSFSFPESEAVVNEWCILTENTSTKTKMSRFDESVAFSLCIFLYMVMYRPFLFKC